MKSLMLIKSKQTDIAVVEEVFGEVVDKTSELKICPNTKKSM